MRSVTGSSGSFPGEPGNTTARRPPVPVTKESCVRRHLFPSLSLRHRAVPSLVAVLVTGAAVCGAPAAGAHGLADLTGSSAPSGTRSAPAPSTTYSTDTRDNIVAFGDSFTANSSSLVNADPEHYPRYPRTAGCLVAPEAWPGMLALLSSRPVQNWACNAHTTGQMLGRVDRAVAAGEINDTSTVVLAAGMNDKRQGVPDADVTANLVTAVAKVRDAAPGASVIILGRLATTDPDGRYCGTNTVPDRPVGTFDQPTAGYERATQDNQRAAAAQAGVPFIDVRTLTVATHSSCAPDAQRFVSGTEDTTTPDYNMPGHPSLAGSTFLALRVKDRLDASRG